MRFAPGCHDRLLDRLRRLLAPGEILLQLAGPVDRLARGEVLQLEQLAKLDLALAAFSMRRGNPLGPLDRLVPGFHLDQPVTGDELLRLGEGPVDHARLAAGELDARALRGRVVAPRGGGPRG